MSGEKHSQKLPAVDENLNPKSEDSKETKQVEEKAPSFDIFNANLSSRLDFASSCSPTFDIALSQLVTGGNENEMATPESAEDPIATLKSTTDRIAELERAAERMTVSGSAASQKAATGSAAGEKAATGSSADRVAASKSTVQASAPLSLELPAPPRLMLIHKLVKEQFPALFDEGNRLRDIYGITNIQDPVLLESHNRLLFILYEHRTQKSTTSSEILISECLIIEVKRLYCLGLLSNMILEGDLNNYPQLYPRQGEHGGMICAALILGFTLLAFADYTYKGRDKRLKELVEKCRVENIPLPNEPQPQPMHPVARWLQCVTISYTEMKQYIEVLKDAISYFSTRNIASINKELDGLSRK